MSLVTRLLSGVNIHQVFGMLLCHVALSCWSIMRIFLSRPYYLTISICLISDLFMASLTSSMLILLSVLDMMYCHDFFEVGTSSSGFPFCILIMASWILVLLLSAFCYCLEYEKCVSCF